VISSALRALTASITTVLDMVSVQHRDCPAE
jgi:hypothetical protein